MRVKLKFLLGAGLLLFQLGMIGYSRFVPTRFFCWAPFDSQSDYQIHVVLRGRELSENEIQERYRILQSGSNNRNISHIIKILQQYEETYGQNDGARVRLSYSVNGKAEEVWQWPPHG